MKQTDNIIIGLDIGASKLCAVIAEIKTNNNLNIHGIGITPLTHDSSKKNLPKSILTTIQRAEQSSAKTSKNIIVNIPSNSLEFAHNSGLLVSKNDNGQISNEDYLECVKRSKNIARTSDKTLVHAIALSHKVEDIPVQNPIGVFGQRLETLSHLVFAPTQTIKTLQNSLKEHHYCIKGMMYDSYGQSELLIDHQESKQGAILLDIGSTSSKLSFIKYNKIHKSIIIPIGGYSITKDIATCLKVSIPEAERIKILHGNIHVKQINPDDNFEITQDDGTKKRSSTLLLTQIIQARIRELLLFCMKKLPLISEEKYPVILTGGGALLDGLIPFCQSYLNPLTKLGTPHNKNIQLESPSHSSAIGMILYALKTKAITHTSTSYPVMEKITQWIKRPWA